MDTAKLALEDGTVFTGQASVGDYLAGFFFPTILGNTLGGVALVALLNHAPLAPEFQD